MRRVLLWSIPLAQASQSIRARPRPRRPASHREAHTIGTGRARESLLEVYAPLICVNPDLDRTLVSFQANKHEPFYRWFKYKEGFSSQLVRYFLQKLTKKPGVLLDPFAGAGAALFASRDLGWDTIGIELLPVGIFGMNARQSAEKVDPEVFQKCARLLAAADLAEYREAARPFPHISITEGAFPPRTEKDIPAFMAFCQSEIPDNHTRVLFEFACFSILEEVSYTRKDGQYLRWDHRCPRRALKGKFFKGKIPSFRKALQRKIQRMADDVIASAAFSLCKQPQGALDIRQASSLEELPKIKHSSIDLVITSPPYCNRYDYTRTYALELAFLGHTNGDVKELRQNMLSCTVENKEKRQSLRVIYEKNKRLSHFTKVDRVFEAQEALQETLSALDALREQGSLNNPNVPRMVKNYFYEMCFIIAELARLLRPGGKIVMVNDNVRYAGEEVPVDLVLSDFAASFGLNVKHIWALPRGKGNSSQQMGAHGRRELRKCVYVWEK